MIEKGAPLAGLKVVELARILAGPWIGQTLADLGADVIKVESTEGDDTRQWGPPFVQDAHGVDIDAAYFNLNYLVSGEVPKRHGNAHPNIVPYQVFAVTDGHVMLAVGNDAQFRSLCEVLQLPAVASDLRYADNAGRVRHREALIPSLEAAFLQHARDEILSKLEHRGVPAGPINQLDDVFNDPQVRHRQLQLDLAATGHRDGHLPGVRTPIGFSDASLETSRRSPGLGEHTAQVIAELDAGDTWKRTS